MKKTTIKDVAKEANVSISVVSYVLNHSTEKSISEDTKKRVRAAAEKLCYIPNRRASGMRNKKALSIGIVTYWNMDIMLSMEMLKGINNAALLHQYSVVLCQGKRDSDEFYYLNYFLDGTIDGIIFISPYEAAGSIDETAHIHKMKATGVPFVMINGHTSHPDVNYVNIDFYASTFLAASHLFGKGYKEVTYVAPFHEHYWELQQRYQGYRDAVSKFGAKEILCDVGEIADKIDSFSAVLTHKSDTAHCVMKEAYQRNIKIPDDFVLIAGNTEAFSQYLLPSLSTVKIPAEKMGEFAAENLFQSFKKKTKAVTVTLPCELEIRNSC